MKPGREVAATLTRAQIESVAEKKMDDLNTKDLAMASNIVKGTARSMGIKVSE